MVSHKHLYKELEEEQVGKEFTEEKNFTRCKSVNWLEKCNKHFRMWLQYSKLILFKEGLLIFI